MTRDTGIVLRVEHLTMRFGGLVAVNDLSFDVARGAITALIGPNGAGKTTVFNCITGFYKPSEGRLALQRGDPALWDALERLTDSGERGVTEGDSALYLLERMPDFLVAQKARVARTFQNIRLFPGMTVLENLLVAQHNSLMLASGYTLLGVLGFPSYTAAQRAAVDKARAWLDRFGLIERADDPAGVLPYGAQRRLEIARAMCTDPVLLCLDEPAAGLNPRESAELNELLLVIRDQYQDLDPLDRARHVGGDENLRPHRRARLWRQDRRGRTRGGPQRSESDRGLSGRRRRGSGGSGSRGGSMSSPLLSVRGVTAFYGRVPALKGVDLEINSGEIVALIGANGAGKSTLMMTVCGNPRARDGEIIFAGRDITRLPTHEIARLKLAQSPEGRRIFPRMTVLENLQMGATVAAPADFASNLDRVLALFPRIKERLTQRGGTLSGGEQQMLAIARALMSRPQLLLLDEPSLGLAPLIVQQIFDAIKKLNSRRRPQRLSGRAERISRAAACPPRLCDGQWPDHPLRQRPRLARPAGSEIRLSGRRPATSQRHDAELFL